MDSACHAVVRGPNFTLFGYRPDFTPAHQVLLETGYTARICGRRTKPVVGKGITFRIAMTPSRVENAMLTCLHKWFWAQDVPK